MQIYSSVMASRSHALCFSIACATLTHTHTHMHTHIHTHTHMHTALPVPETPLSLQVTSVTTTTATVTWSAPPFDPQNLVAFYNLTVSEDTFGLPDVEVMFTGATFRYTFSGLEEYVNYTCDVISVGVFGTYSIPASTDFTTLEASKEIVDTSWLVSYCPKLVLNKFTLIGSMSGLSDWSLCENFVRTTKLFVFF